MEKRTRYGGNIRADLKDYGNFVSYLEERGVDTNLYRPVGAIITHGNTLPTMIDVICLDAKKSKAGKEIFISLSFMQDDSSDLFFNIFDRVDIKIAQSEYDISKIEINKRIIIENNEIPVPRDLDGYTSYNNMASSEEE
jgi:hypothetical protein